MKTKQAEFVTFYSPGTLFAETTTKHIESRDIKKAVEMAANVTERHGAQPYAFVFSTRLVADERTEIKTIPKTLRESGFHFLGGKIRTYDEVVRDNDPDEAILRSNMGGSMLVIITTRRGFTNTRPFDPEDLRVDDDGNVTARGTDYDDYRKQKRAEEPTPAGVAL